MIFKEGHAYETIGPSDPYSSILTKVPGGICRTSKADSTLLARISIRYRFEGVPLALDPLALEAAAVSYLQCMHTNVISSGNQTPPHLPSNRVQNRDIETQKCVDMAQCGRVVTS